MGTVCHINDVEIFLFCQKNYAKKKCQFLSLSSIPCLVQNRFAFSRKETGLLSFLSPLFHQSLKVYGRHVSVRTRMRIMGPQLSILVPRDPKEDLDIKALFVKLKLTPKCLLSLLARYCIRYVSMLFVEKKMRF